MMYTPLFLACKFLRAQTSSLTLSFITKLCISSIIISSAALALIASIMQGFHDATLKTLKGMSPDLVIKAPRGYLDAPKVKAIIDNEFQETVAATTPCNLYHVLVQNTHNARDFSHVCLVAAIDPATLEPIIPFSSAPACREHGHGFMSLKENNEDAIIIGDLLAKNLGVACGDTLIMRYLEDQEESKNLSFSTAKVHIAGIFHAGVEDWDAQGAFITLSCAHQLFNDDQLIQQLYVKLHPTASLPQVQVALQQRLQLSVVSWYDLNPALVSALLLEKSALAVLLMLILLVGGITLASLMCLQLTYHKRTIAVLATYGMSHHAIVQTFILYGMCITVGATSVGLAIATGLSYLIDHYQLIQLPDIYYTAHLPSHMSWQIIGIILLLACVTSFLVSWYPARNIRQLPLARIIADV